MVISAPHAGKIDKVIVNEGVHSLQAENANFVGFGKWAGPDSENHKRRVTFWRLLSKGFLFPSSVLSVFLASYR